MPETLKTTGGKTHISKDIRIGIKSRIEKANSCLISRQPFLVDQSDD